MHAGSEATDGASVVGGYTGRSDWTNWHEAATGSFCVLPEDCRIRFFLCFL